MNLTKHLNRTVQTLVHDNYLAFTRKYLVEYTEYTGDSKLRKELGDFYIWLEKLEVMDGQMQSNNGTGADAIDGAGDEITG